MGEDEDGRVLLAGGSSEFAPPAVVRERQSAHLRVALFRAKHRLAQQES